MMFKGAEYKNRPNLILSISDALGGAEQVLFKMAMFYAKQKDTKVIVCFLKRQTNNYWFENLGSNVDIYYLDNNLLTLFNKLRLTTFDKVFSSHLMINSLLGFARTLGVLKTKSLIVRESTQVFGRYKGFKLFKYKLAYYLGYRNIDLIICQTQRMLEVLALNIPYLFKRIKICVVPNPFDFPSTESVNEEINLPENAIVTAGRLIPEKGFDILIKSYYEVQKKIPDLKLFILGEGNERQNLEKHINDLNLNDKVFLIGHVNNVYPFFKKATLCVVSSIKEGFPNVLLQMMSQNNRIVSTDCAGGIKDLEGVLVVNPGDVESLSIAIHNLLIKDVDNFFVFDKELEKRNIDSFIKSIERELYDE